MPDEVVSAIVLRHVPHGDADIIATMFTREFGKIAVIGKSAQNSVKRFQGTLELFVYSQAVLASGRGGMRVVKEASLINAFEHIREDVYWVAYASYWAELLLRFLEDGHCQPELFDLLEKAYTALNDGRWTPEELNILFQIRFLSLTGFLPNLETCGGCQKPLADMKQECVVFSISDGMILCADCVKLHRQTMFVSPGTIKQLLWMISRDVETAFRARLTKLSQNEGTQLLETFISFHLPMKLKSLRFLQQIRGEI